MNPWEEIKRHARLKTIREANRKSRHRKKVLVEMLQGRIVFFTRTNEQLRQNNDVLEGLLILARNNLRKQQEQQITQNAFVAYWLAMAPLSNAAFGMGCYARNPMLAIRVGGGGGGKLSSSSAASYIAAAAGGVSPSAAMRGGTDKDKNDPRRMAAALDATATTRGIAECRGLGDEQQRRRGVMGDDVEGDVSDMPDHDGPNDEEMGSKKSLGGEGLGLGTTTMTTTTNRGSDPDDVSDSVPHSGEHIVDDDHDGNGGGKETSHGSGAACMHPTNNDDRPHLPGSRRRPERDNEPPRGIARGPRSVVDSREEARMRRGGGVTTMMTGGGRGDGTVDRRCPCPSLLGHRQTTTDMDDVDVPTPALSQFSHSSDDDDIVDGRGGACGSGEQNSFQPGMNYEKTTLMRAADSEMEKPKETSNDDDLDGMERMRSVSSLSSNKDDLGGRGSRGSELPTNDDEQCVIDALRSLRKKLAVDVSDVRFIILNQIHLNNYTHCIFSFTC